jgi:aryl-alcohol dehydrogenase-like predicted oxidoreductase
MSQSIPTRPRAPVPRGARQGLPDWARGFAGSWAQFFLKYLLSDPRVTAVIPGTSDAGHMIDNLGAMRGPLPDPDQRKQMVAFAEAL